ncbi:hypothetical protein HT031_000613 [Scenedesmus sp. PABB004]|nr:hypothetical protein HT031_000613 [Scenedesmus sp. PABB004]
MSLPSADTGGGGSAARALPAELLVLPAARPLLTREQNTADQAAQGNPLVPGDLAMVAAGAASSTIIVSDQSRSGVEADAQALRCAILLDEMTTGGPIAPAPPQLRGRRGAARAAAAAGAAGDGLAPLDARAVRGPVAGVLRHLGPAAAREALDRSLLARQVVVELRTSNSLPLLKFACNSRIIALATTQLNAQRLSKMVKRPVMSVVSHSLFDFDARVAVFVHYCPSLVGARFGDLPHSFPDGVVLGVVDRLTGRGRLAPPRRFVLRDTHALAATRAAAREHEPGGWEARRGEPLFSIHQMLDDATLSGLRAHEARRGAASRASCSWDDGLPRPAARRGLGQEEVQRGAAEAGGSSYDATGHVRAAPGGGPAAGANNIVPVGARGGAGGLAGARVLARRAGPAPRRGGALLPARRRRRRRRRRQMQQLARRGAPRPPAATAAAAAAARGGVEPASASASSALVPPEYLEANDGPQRLVVLGWGSRSLMADLIRELDHGLSALPRGSEVVFLNSHAPEASLGAVLAGTSLENIQVRHVQANPLVRSSIAAKLDVTGFRCAMVLCDELWVDHDGNEANGIDGDVDAPSVLRMDSLVMVAQLNVRKLLEDAAHSPINIISQKVANEGLTRFEDRLRLPLGISVNFNSYTAKVLSQVAANPLMMYPVTRLGENAQITIVDSAALCGRGEAATWWQLAVRAGAVGDVLLGHYAVPADMDTALDTVLAPEEETRLVPRVWNNGSGTLKFVVLRPAAGHDDSSGSADDAELEHTHQARWVAAAHAEHEARRSHCSAASQGSPADSTHSVGDAALG